MQLVVLILAIFVKVWFSIFRVQLQKEGKVRRRKGAKGRPAVPQLFLGPRCSQTFPSLTVCRDCGPRLKHFPLAETFRSPPPPVTAPNNSNDRSYHR